MGTKLKYGTERGAITVDGDQKEIINDLLKAAEPAIMAALKDQVEELENNAKKNWPVRQQRKNRNGSVKKDSQSLRSIDAFETEIRIIPPATIRASVTNTAPYAYAIRAGRKSESKNAQGQTISVKAGKRVSLELMWEPAKKGTKELLQTIGKETIRRLK